MSLGGPHPDFKMYRSTRTAHEASVILVVAAAGENGGDNDMKIWKSRTSKYATTLLLFYMNGIQELCYHINILKNALLYLQLTC